MDMKAAHKSDVPSFLDSRKKGCMYEEDIKIYWTVNKYYYAYSICGVYSSFNKCQGCSS